MSSYMPGGGLKKPLNMLQGPVYPDIRKAPPRFVWSKKSWNVDAGQTLKSVENTPQYYDSTVLFQSRDYNSQHAYGKYPSYDVVVNKAFRPPLIDRDDVIPLSRIPRPAIVPHINPGTAYGGGGVYQAQNSTTPPELHKFITDRIKSTEIRPTFFAPLYTPVDNSVLPDLELNIPSVSGTTGFKYASRATPAELMDLPELEQNLPSVSASSGNQYKTYNDLNINENQYDGSVVDHINYSLTSGVKIQNNGSLPEDPNYELHDNRPKISLVSGNKFRNNGMLVEQDISGIEYLDLPSVSIGAGHNYRSNGVLEPHQKKLYDKRPSISMTSGRKERSVNKLESPNYELIEKLEGTQPYANPNNTRFKSDDRDSYNNRMTPYREKSSAYSHTTPYNAGGYIPRQGVTVPNGVNLKQKKY